MGQAWSVLFSLALAIHTGTRSGRLDPFNPAIPAFVGVAVALGAAPVDPDDPTRPASIACCELHHSITRGSAPISPVPKDRQPTPA